MGRARPDPRPPQEREEGAWPGFGPQEREEGRARFVLDDPSEAYLWRGLEECGRASVEAINRAFELMSRDMFKFAQVRSLSLSVKCCLFMSLD